MTKYKLILLFVFTSVLVSCKNDMTDLDRYFDESKSMPSQQIDPLPEIHSPEIFVYEAEELRNPFSNDLEMVREQVVDIEKSDNGEGPDTNRRKELLESFPIDSLNMVGTYMQDDIYWGLVEDPEGDIHRASLGSFLGQNYGEIIAISEDQIEVSEWVSDGLGGWTKREASIALREE